MVRLSLPSRLKSHNGKAGDSTSQSASRAESPMRGPTETKGLILKTQVLRVGIFHHIILAFGVMLTCFFIGKESSSKG